MSIGGKLDTAGMAALAPPPREGRPPAYRPPQTDEQRRIATLDHQLTVALSCLGDACRALAFYGDPYGRQAQRTIRARLDAAGLGGRAEVKA